MHFHKHVSSWIGLASCIFVNRAKVTSTSFTHWYLEWRKGRYFSKQGTLFHNKSINRLPVCCRDYFLLLLMPGYQAKYQIPHQVKWEAFPLQWKRTKDFKCEHKRSVGSLRKKFNLDKKVSLILEWPRTT